MRVSLLRMGNVSECLIIRRLNRFVVEVLWKDRRVRAYITNTGRLEELIRDGRKGFCIPGGRRTKCRLFAVEDSGKGAIIDTALQMKAFENAVEFLPWIEGCNISKRNVKVGRSLLDYLFKCGEHMMYVEVKSAVLRGPSGYAMYPDCPTERGRRHIRKLIELAKKGEKACIVFIAAMPGAKGFMPYGGGDPEIPRLLADAARAGVMIKAIGIYYEPFDGSVRLYSPDLEVKIGVDR